MAYDNQAYSYVATHAQTIKDTAGALGVSETAIAGAMAEEFDSYADSPAINHATDAYALDQLTSHDQIAADAHRVNSSGEADAMGNNLLDKLGKFGEPVLMDVGGSNIKVSSAVRLLDDYVDQYISNGADPLGLSGYQNDYVGFVNDLTDLSSDLSPKITGLMIKEASDYFDLRADTEYWNGLDQKTKDGVLITYFNNGPSNIEERYQQDVANNEPYTPSPGGGPSGGLEHINNYDAIRNTLGDPGSQLQSNPLEDHSGDVADWQGWMPGNIGDQISQGVENIGDVVSDFNNDLTQFVDELSDSVGDAAVEFGQDVKDTVNEIRQSLKDTLSDLYDGASTEVSEALDGAEQWFDDLSQQIENGVDQFGQDVNDHLNDAGDPFSEAIMDAGTAIDQMVDQTSQNLSEFSDALSDIVDGLSQEVSDAITGAYQDAIDAVSNAMSDAESAYNNLSDLASNAIDKASDFVDDMVNSASGAFSDFVDDIGDAFNNMEDAVNDFFGNARNWIQRRDPLTLDLDGDGLETVGIDSDNPILFDHNGDGTANATGWIAPDDGFLVLDRNENGLIDNGTELFGDSTPLLDENGDVTGTAADGFAALAAEDTNGDGIVDANDANWENLQVWQDANSDGKTDEGELHTPEELGIAGFHVEKEEHTQILANGNAVADLGTFILEDGTEGTLGEVTGNMADIDLADNPFYREFEDSIPLTEQAESLPDMRGSGHLRDLREASSLSSELAGSVANYASAETKAEQLAQVDGLIHQWAETSAGKTGIEQAAEQGYTLQYLVPGLTPSMLDNDFLSSNGSSGSGGGFIDPATQDPNHEQRLEALLAEQARVTELVSLLEQFNGMTFVDIEPEGVRTGADRFIAVSSESDSGGTASFLDGPQQVYVPLSGDQITFLERAYDSLRSSVYDSLLLQTRLKPYMDAIDLTLTDAGLAFDFTDTAAAFQARFGEAPGEAVRDLLDLQRVAGSNLTGMGWDGLGLLHGWLETDGASPDVQAALAEFGYNNIETDGVGTNASEIVMGDATGADLSGGGGDDLILGSAGDDTLNGGAGSDVLYGGEGNDTYRLNLGDGADTIIETHGDTGEDALEFGAGIRAGDLDISTDGNALIFGHSNGQDRITIANWFGSLAEDKHRLDTVNFADGRELDLDALQVGTEGDDTLEGTEANDILAGGAGSDTLYGHDGDDWLDGGSGADTLVGGAGDDTYVVDDADDTVVEEADGGIDTVEARGSATLSDHVENLTLLGGANTSATGNDMDNVLTGNSGNNTLEGASGDDTLYGNSGDDTLHGGEGADTLYGGTGNDRLDGGAGADTLAGGAGNDTYVVDTLDDTVTEAAGEGVDTIQTHLDYSLGDNIENLVLTGEDGVSGTGNELNNELTGNHANNTLQGLQGNDRLDGGAGADTMLGGTGNDTYVVDNEGDAVLENAGEGTDTVESSTAYTLTDHVENLTLTGSDTLDGTGNELDNTLVGNSGANTLYGLEGNDILDGGSGADTLVGGVGNDTYVVDSTEDAVVEHAGEGTDTVRSAITYTLGEHLENLTLTGTTSINGAGNELDNVIKGNDGNNTLDGDLGADVMAGGRGNDTYILDNTGDSVSESAGQGIDTVISPFDYVLGDNVENLTLTGEALTGTGNALNNTITGTDADNTLNGHDGNDTLNGGAGTDTLVGGRGNDTYVVDRSDDTVVEAVGEGIDTVRSSVTWTLGENLENLTLTGSDAIDGTGNEIGNVIRGNSADNTLTGFGGDDTLDGGAGADVLEGGTGNDTYVVDNIGDSVIEAQDEGIDEVHASVDYTLTDHVENLTLTGQAAINGAGNALDNVIQGNSGANVLEGFAGDDTLDGGSGADTLIGGAGDDTYFVDHSGDTVVENNAEGYDRVYASSSHELGDNVEELTLTGNASIDGRGNALDNVLTGNSGNNRLDGGAGADTMTGGAGNDTYVVDHQGDVVNESAYEGFDKVEASVDYTLGDYVEDLTLTGEADLRATGNSLNNVLTANSGNSTLEGMAGNDTLIGMEGNDRLDGGTGADIMAGGSGDDYYMVDSTGDRVIEGADGGTDSVEASISYTLTDHFEHLELTGSEAIDGTGNTLDNTITGNSAANRIDGGVGADVMAGGAGDDTYIVDNAGDSIIEAVGEGIDTVEASVSQTLSDNVENLVLTGAEDLNGTGNALDNTIIGNAGDNVLDGGAGTDTLIGGLGDDTYVVDDSADIVSENDGEGVDTVVASADYALSDNVEHLTLTGDANLNGTGNSLDNVITGNDGTNVLAGKGGDDTYIVNDSQDSVLEQAGEGIDTVLSSADYTLSDHVENLTLTGTADIDGRGNELDNVISGNSGANYIDGGAGADSMAGGMGDDTYIVDHTGDSVIEAAGEGTDIVFASVSHALTSNVENLTLTGEADIDGTGNNLDNIILGNTGDNRLNGGSGNDQLFGDAGNDTLNGGSGADAMVGGTGDDTYIVDNSGDQVTELAGEGVDTVQSSVSYTLTDNVENLTLTGSSGISGTGNELDNVITGNNGSNTLRGLAGDDTLVGNSGHDTLDGGTGADTMSGGTGNDTYVVDDAGDVVTEGANAGTDTVQSSIDYTLTSNVENLTLTGTENLDGTGNNLNNVITGNSGDNVLDGQGGNDTLNAGGGNDILQGGEGHDTLRGGAGDDQLNGGDGNDTLDGGVGADTMAGGTGNDTYVVDDAGDLVTEMVGEGTDTVQSSITYTLTDNVENLTLTGTSNIDGTGNELDNIIRGNNGANVLDGLGGNDTLNGGSGADAMAGGTGDDTYIVDNSGDQVTELAGEGVDMVQSSISYTLTDNVENLTLTGPSGISGTGNELDNVITGNNGSNTLRGLAGDDTLVGNSGHDTLDGGTGADTMSGGYGNDTYVVDDAGDVVSEGANAGIDTVQSSIDYTLTSNVENLTLTGTENLDGTGNNLNNVIAGNSGDNVLDGQGGNDTLNAGDGNDILQGGEGHDTLRGGAGNDQLNGGGGNDTLDGGVGADTMAGGTGNDTYVVDDADDLVTEMVGEGTDTVQSSITYTLTDHVENLTLTGSADIDGTGNELDNLIQGNSGANVLAGLAGDDTLYGNTGADTLLGGDGNDQLYGGSGNDQLSGDAGNDTLNGGSGADAMAGGTGDDTYIVDNSGDQVTELGGEGVDTVQASVSYTLTGNVENLTLTGSSGISGTGNELDNVITGNNGSNTLRGLAGDDTLVGNSGHDTLDGGTGADTMSGGYGNDTYVVDDTGDVVSEGANAGIDTVQSSIDYTLTSNVENLTLTGTENLDGTGNNLNNVITGNVGNNVLDGGSGADTLIGGLGDDSYFVDHSADVIVEKTDEGTDTVVSTADYTLSGHIENLTLVGTAGLSGTGNATDNQIIGNVGNNHLAGNGGDDALFGGEGNDSLYGGSGRDQLFGGSGNDLLDGGTGADLMQGGTGDDIYVVDDSGDVVMESEGEGFDTVRASIDYTLGDNVENLELIGSAAIDSEGNAANNTITGNDGDNVLRGLEGDDTLVGNGGNDTLDGGAGADLMGGGTGDDTYVVDDAGDVVRENANAGTDTVQSSIDYTLANNVENLILTGAENLSGTGNSLNNEITGNNGANVLDGGAGADTMAGGDGDDMYIVDNAGDVVFEQEGEGVDTVFASASHTLDANVENLNLTGDLGINGTGNELDNWITGNAGANTLSGGDGSDVLDGGAGADTLYGNAGDDTYVVDNIGDRVVEIAGEGVDTVQAGVDFTLSDNIENLSLTGKEDIDGTGNDLDNWITGNDGNNTLIGGAGNDVLEGGLGDDVLMGGAGNDRYIFRPGEGNDTFLDTQGQDSLYVGGNLTEFDLEADRVGNDMHVQVLGSTESFVLSDWFESAEGIKAMEFDDGTILDRDGIALLMNRPPVANTDSMTAYEDGGPVTFGVDYLLANDTDPNPGDILSVISVGESGVGASVSLENGQVTYDIGSSFQALAEGEEVQDSFSYTISDDKGATDTGTVQATIVGTNDLPVTIADTDSVTEDQVVVAEGNVLANDHDIDATDVLRVVESGEHAGTYGTLSMSEYGDYTYTLNNESADVQSLGRSTEMTERFDFMVTDGHSEVASNLQISVNGTNDAPFVANALEDQDFTFHKPFSWQVPEGSFQDLDQGDVLDYTATLADGSELPSWLEFDGETQTFSGHTPKAVGYIDVKVTVTDRVESSGSTEGSLSTSDVFRLSVSHGNQGVGNGSDAPPAGHTTNFNDGAGTSPGHPGARTASKKKAVDLTQEESVEHTKPSISNVKFAEPKSLDSTGRVVQVTEESSIDVNALLTRWEAIDKYVAAHASKNNGSGEAEAGALPVDSIGGLLGSNKRWSAHDPVALKGAENRMHRFKGLQEGMDHLG